MNPQISVKPISINKIKKSCTHVCLILKALSHPQRLLILGYLLNGPKMVSELVESCSISQSQMSQFLIRMKLDGLIASKREGRFQYYTLADQRLINLMKTIQNEYC